MFFGRILNSFLCCFRKNCTSRIHKCKVSSVAASYVPDLKGVSTVNSDLESVLRGNRTGRSLTTKAESKSTGEIIPSLFASINSGVLTINEGEDIVVLENVAISIGFLTELCPSREVDKVIVSYVIRISFLATRANTIYEVVTKSITNCFPTVVTSHRLGTSRLGALVVLNKLYATLHTCAGRTTGNEPVNVTLRLVVIFLNETTDCTYSVIFACFGTSSINFLLNIHFMSVLILDYNSINSATAVSASNILKTVDLILAVYGSNDSFFTPESMSLGILFGLNSLNFITKRTNVNFNTGSYTVSSNHKRMPTNYLLKSVLASNVIGICCATSRAKTICEGVTKSIALSLTTCALLRLGASCIGPSVNVRSFYNNVNFGTLKGDSYSTSINGNGIGLIC